MRGDGGIYASLFSYIDLEKRCPSYGGTEGSNPSPSSAESVSVVRSVGVGEKAGPSRVASLPARAKRHRSRRGTGGSNPSRSAGESVSPVPSVAAGACGSSSSPSSNRTKQRDTLSREAGDGFIGYVQNFDA
jgi:hypothetical protein